MKKQVSGNAKNLKWSYIPLFLIFLIIGLFTAASVIFNTKPINTDISQGISIGFILIGLTFTILSNKFIPYCYKIEVEENTIYITKKETIILTEIEKTIEVSKDQILNVKSSPFGFSVFIWTSNVFYLELKEDTEYGRKIAFLTKMKNSIGKNFDELDLLK